MLWYVNNNVLNVRGLGLMLVNTCVKFEMRSIHVSQLRGHNPFLMHLVRYLYCTPHHDNPPPESFESVEGNWLSLPSGWLSVLLSVYCARSVNPKPSFTICLLNSGLWGPWLYSHRYAGATWSYGHKRVCYALVNRESPTRHACRSTSNSPTTDSPS